MQPTDPRHGNPLRGATAYQSPYGKPVPKYASNARGGAFVAGTPSTTTTTVTTVTVTNRVGPSTIASTPSSVTYVSSNQGVNPRAVGAHVVPQNDGSLAVSYSQARTQGRRAGQ
ncbi:MAG: hypothetical protein KDK62_01475 [Chlamydiia bacterium]|nr:hypothetical protein [Chlamydiia bacterium]